MSIKSSSGKERESEAFANVEKIAPTATTRRISSEPEFSACMTDALQLEIQGSGRVLVGSAAKWLSAELAGACAEVCQ